MKYRDGEGPRVLREPGLLDLNQQDYPTQLNKALGLQVRPPGHIDPRVSVGVQLDDYTSPEYWWLRRGIRGYAGDARGATAAQYAFFAIQCLPGSVLVVEKLVISKDAAAEYLIVGLQAAQPAAAAATAGTPTDSRAFGQGGAARWVLSSSVAVPTGPVIPTRIYCGAAQSVVLDTPFILTNGFWLSVICQAVNTSLGVTAFYRERRLLPSEE
jgi:hypothetical protein